MTNFRVYLGQALSYYFWYKDWPIGFMGSKAPFVYFSCSFFGKKYIEK